MREVTTIFTEQDREALRLVSDLVFAPHWRESIKHAIAEIDSSRAELLKAKGSAIDDYAETVIVPFCEKVGAEDIELAADKFAKMRERAKQQEAALRAWGRFAAECRQRNVVIPLWAAVLNEEAVELTRTALAPAPEQKEPVLDGIFDHQEGCRAPDYSEYTCKSADVDAATGTADDAISDPVVDEIRRVLHMDGEKCPTN